MTMKIKLKNTIFLLLTLTIVTLTYTECKQLPILSLTAREVYRLLRQAGRQDAIPEGRVITQGLAAMTGFAFGLKKALAGVFLYDIITANVTDLDLGLGNAVNTSAVDVGTRQEICFNSRKSRNLKEATAVAEAYEWLDENEGKLGKSNSRKSKRKHKRSRRHKRYIEAISRQAATTGVGTTSTADGTATEADSAVATSPTTTTGSLTTPDTGTGITSATTTSTGNGNEAATNCFVVQ